MRRLNGYLAESSGNNGYLVRSKVTVSEK